MNHSLPAAGDSAEIAAETRTAEETGQEAAPDPAAEFARRVVQVPDMRPAREASGPSTDERDITAENVDQMVLANLEHALKGEMASAYFVTRSRLTCDRFADSPEQLERAIRQANRRVEFNRTRGRDRPSLAGYDLPWSLTDDPEDNRAHMERWYDACQRVMAIFTPDLRRQLELQALDGDIMARYLYATWPEDLLDAGQAFDQQYRWESLAREFSRANLDSGQVAGMMAFAQSYLSGWFTARNHDLALAFGVAALNCGFETVSVRSFMASSIERLTASENPEAQQRLQFILSEADQIGHGCHY